MKMFLEQTPNKEYPLKLNILFSQKDNFDILLKYLYIALSNDFLYGQLLSLKEVPMKEILDTLFKKKTKGTTKLKKNF